jgi:hypothetical protein
MMRRLREYRRLHELYWEPSDEMTRPTPQKKIDEMEAKLLDRGGSKKETVYDLVAREKWKMRVKMVMDQKANSIADLAATLLKQDEEGAHLTGEYERLRQNRRKVDVEEMIRLASDRDSFDLIESLQSKKHSLQEQLAAIPKGEGKQRLPIQIKKLNLRIKKKTFAIDQVAAAREARGRDPVREFRKTAKQARAAKRAELQRTGADDQEVRSAVQAAIRAIRPDPTRPVAPWSKADIAHLRAALPPFPDTIKFLKPSKSAPRFKPIFSADNVTIRWANTLDAEYAEEWPANVALEPLGITRYRHPKLPSTDKDPEFEPIVEVAEFKALGWKLRKENFELEEETKERVEARRREMGLQEDPNRKNRFVVPVSKRERRLEAGKQWMQAEALRRTEQAVREGRVDLNAVVGEAERAVAARS